MSTYEYLNAVDAAQYTTSAVRVTQRASQPPAAARCAVERNDEYLCTGGAYRRHINK